MGGEVQGPILVAPPICRLLGPAKRPFYLSLLRMPLGRNIRGRKENKLGNLQLPRSTLVVRLDRHISIRCDRQSLKSGLFSFVAVCRQELQEPSYVECRPRLFLISLHRVSPT